MGRVYKALVKADRWKDRGYRIGQPVGAPGRHPAFSAGERLAHDHSYEPTDPAALFNFNERPPEAGETAFDFNDSIALIETIAAAQRHKHHQPHTLVAADPVPSQAPVFVEPRTVFNVRDLKIESHWAALHDKDPFACERYRTLAVGLLSLTARRKMKTVLVTSAEEGEGKTTIAINLAWSIAESLEGRVLLLDANPGASPLSRVLGPHAKRGWMDIAEGRCSLADAACVARPNGLYMLTSGGYGQAGDDALASPVFDRLIASLEADFDLLIIDSPAILESPGAQRLASLVDGTVFVVRAGHTHHSAVTDGLKLLPPERRLGLVLNESDVENESPSKRNKKPKGRSVRRSR
jgi:Mrp family chromosome partitioning ATPase